MSLASCAESGLLAIQSVMAGRPPSPQDAEYLRKCLRMIGDMAERFLAHHDVHALVRQGDVHHVALPDAGTVLQTNQCDEFLRGGDTRRCQFDTGHVGAVTVREIAYGAAEAGAEIGDLGAGPDRRGPPASASVAAMPP